jgi:hypothetical protein
LNSPELHLLVRWNKLYQQRNCLAQPVMNW